MTLTVSVATSSSTWGFKPAPDWIILLVCIFFVSFAARPAHPSAAGVHQDPVRGPQGLVRPGARVRPQRLDRDQELARARLSQFALLHRRYEN